MRFAEVAVDAPVGPGQTFTYSVPPSAQLGVGRLVAVPFGPRRLQGVVFAMSDAPQVPDTRDLVSVDEEVPPLTSTQLELASWMSGYYLCSLFDAAQAMLPPGRRARLRAYFSPTDAAGDADASSLPALQGRVLAYLRRRGEVAEARVVAAFGPDASGALRRLERRGLAARADRRSAPTVTHKFRRMVRLSASRPEADLGKAPKQAALLERLRATGEPMALSDANREYGAGAVRALLSKGVIESYDERVDRDPLGGLDLPTAPAVTLTATQEKAAAEIRRAASGAGGARRRFLLEGVTGSGKTEVYLEAARHCLQVGKRAIVLVPEIALTHQTVERFSSRFPGRVAVIHSGLTAGQRFDQWHRVREGRYGIVVGSRGAVFAPQPDLGLVVLDEEHEWTYKQHDSAPRYHARDVALKLADLTGAGVILGSATPALETRHMALRGEARPLLLPTRVSAGRRGAAASPGAMAPVQVVDMRRELREGHAGAFSRPLTDALGRALEDGGQTILFLNRRGSASYLQCRGCGRNLKCRGCDTPTAYHRDLKMLLCHYCGVRRRPPGQCPACRSYRLSYFGIGSKAVVDEVERLFPGTPTIRWDRDAAVRPGQHAALLERFRSGEARVLVGTQMIAKGLHFPGVTLVGVVLADVGLNAPDFRAGERAFQVLCQVAGRAGRGARRGRVIVQTYRPENYAVRAAASQDYRRFFAQEMAHRREQGNPPYASLIRLMNVHTNAALCEREALRLADQLTAERDASGHAEVEVLGPTPAYPSRLRGRYRWQILLRGPNPRVLLEDARLPRAWTIDVDPLGMG